MTGAGQGRARQDRAGARIGQGSAMHEAGQGKARGTAGAAAGAGEGQGRAMLDRGRVRAVTWQGAFGAPFFPSITPEKGTLGAHKKRSSITYVTYMVVTPLVAASDPITTQPFL